MIVFLLLVGEEGEVEAAFELVEAREMLDTCRLEVLLAVPQT